MAEQLSLKDTLKKISKKYGESVVKVGVERVMLHAVLFSK